MVRELKKSFRAFYLLYGLTSMVLPISTHWNFNLSIPGAPQPVMSSSSKVLPEYVLRRAVDMSHTSASSGYTDTEALMYADLAGGPAPSDSEVGSHTDSILTSCIHDRVKCIYSAFIIFYFKQRSATPVGPRRSSITSDFLAEENRREKELERLLDRRIADLKTNTDYIIQKYRWHKRLLL